jgi:glycerol-3-phosphate O-acyltransferase
LLCASHILTPNPLIPLIDIAHLPLPLPNTHTQVAAQIAAGESVVLLANHQTEADPGVFAHMLIHSFPNLATDVIYVAGDRVVTDPLCKPFSMGRNLFCVHSKKHMDDVLELKAAKMETNRKTLVAMQRAFNKGG